MEEADEQGWRYLAGPGRPSVAAVQQFAHIFRERWGLGQRAAMGYPYPPIHGEAQGTGRRAEQLKAIRRLWINAVLASARACRGWEAAGPLELTVRDAVWLDGVLDGVTNVLLPSGSRCAEIREVQTRPPCRSAGADTASTDDFAVMVSYTSSSTAADTTTESVNDMQSQRGIAEGSRSSPLLQAGADMDEPTEQTKKKKRRRRRPRRVRNRKTQLNLKDNVYLMNPEMLVVKPDVRARVAPAGPVSI